MISHNRRQPNLQQTRTTGSGKTVSHNYLLPGIYTVKLTTKDNNGATTTKSVGIAVTD